MWPTTTRKCAPKPGCINTLVLFYHWKYILAFSEYGSTLVGKKIRKVILIFIVKLQLKDEKKKKKTLAFSPKSRMKTLEC